MNRTQADAPDTASTEDIAYIDIQFLRAERDEDSRIVVNSYGIKAHSKEQLVMALEDAIASIKASSSPETTD